MDTREIDELLAGATPGVAPGGVLVVGDGGAVVLERAFGLTATAPVPGAPATVGTVYDVASITKAAATTTVVMRLVERGALALGTPVRTLLPELPDGHQGITVRHLLTHSAGLPAWRPFYERLAGVPAPRRALLELIAAEPLEAAPGERSVYSDLGFILLGFLVERAAGERLDGLAAREVFAPLGMTSSRFVDLEATPPAPRPEPVAPTELCPRRGLLAGEVHDDNCHAAGGVLGHAGLFSTVGDLSRLAAALVAAFHGETVPGGFRPDLVRTFFAPAGIPGSTWRLGWDGPSAEPGKSSAGDLWPRDGVGHLGFTGCSLWLDPPRRRWVGLLTNRVHPSRANERIKAFRPRLHDAVVRMLGGRR